MFEALNIKNSAVEPDAGQLLDQIASLTSTETNLTANLANIAAQLNSALPEINWVGFYLYSPADQQLILGPFQGLPACIRINPGAGVCGTAYTSQSSQVVDDVEKFPGHIACDSNSKSEMVIPIFHNSVVVAVLDIDSPRIERFSRKMAGEYEKICAYIGSLFAEVSLK